AAGWGGLWGSPEKKKGTSPPPDIRPTACNGTAARWVIGPVAMATTRKHATPIGTVSAVPWIGVPVTTPRLAAVMFNANDAAESRERIAPSTGRPLDAFAQISAR